MGQLDDLLSAQFGRWEQRGRGWQVHPHPVAPEPPFVPFTEYYAPATSPGDDDGRKPSKLASFFERLEQRVNPPPPPLPPEPEPEEPEPTRLERAPLVELQAVLPAGLDIPTAEFATFLDQLTVCHEPVAFELLGTSERIVAQFAVARQDAPIVRRQVAAYFPEVTFLPQENRLAAAWTAYEGEAALVEFGLEREFLLPLATGGKLDPFVGLIGAMNELLPGELTLFQVLFASAVHPWAPSAWNAVADIKGKGLFVNRPELPDAVRDKFSLPLYGVVARIATQAPDFDRAWQLARELAFSLRGFAHPEGNELIPLRNDDYPFAAHEQDVLRRQSHRSGMLLNAAELAGLVHFPSSAVRSARLQRQAENSRPAPASVLHEHGWCLGSNTHLGVTTPVRLTTEQRTRHLHLVPTEPDTEQAEATRQGVTEASRRRYATPRAEIEAALRASLPAEEAPAKPKSVPLPEPKPITPPTRSERESVPAPASPPTPVVPEERRPALPPPDMGKGGAQHKAIQARLKAGAESLGFHATIEQAVPDGGIDLVLVRGNDRIACEVSVTTTVDHEVGNVRKCLRAGFARVAVICPEAARLEKIRAAVQGSLGPEATANVSYATPDEFLAQLAALPLPTPSPTNLPAPQSTTSRGYAVKRKSATVSAEERAAREQAAITQIAEVMKHKGQS